ncbi:MAG: sugar transferase [Roseburia sp.]|nr:sugar transferase [Roseburia sp.]
MGNKNITNTAKVILNVWNIGLFVLVWALYYNSYTFQKFWVPGAIVSCIIYAFIYYALCNLYQAFRIASTEITDTVFSQTIAFGVADLILYVECCLIYNRYVNIWPGVATALAQIIGTATIVTLTKRYMMNHIVPRKTLLLYGKHVTKEDAEFFVERLMKKYSHLFNVTRIEFDRMSRKELSVLLADCEAVLLYEVSNDVRGKFMKLCTEQKKVLYFTPKIEDILCQGSIEKNLLDTPLMKYEYQYDSRSGYIGKRCLDLVISGTLIIVLSPIMLITAIAIKLEDGGPIFFKQRRCTKDAREFDILKFRSMIVDAEKDGVTPCKGNDSRITKVGKIIRATRIDELPQLINILKDDMSFVGPRPERIEHVEQYTKELPEFSYRMRVKGGLTGYAQIYGKYNTSAYDKLRLDMMYIENQSIILDLKIIMLTFKTIFTPESTEGFSEEKSNAMKEKTADAKVMQVDMQ